MAISYKNVLSRQEKEKQLAELINKNNALQGKKTVAQKQPAAVAMPSSEGAGERGRIMIFKTDYGLYDCRAGACFRCIMRLMDDRRGVISPSVCFADSSLIRGSRRKGADIDFKNRLRSVWL